MYEIKKTAVLHNRPPARRGCALLTPPLLALTLLVAGCSDDVVCPQGADGSAPFVSAAIIEEVARDAARTSVAVYCTADPLPGDLHVVVNDHQLPDVGSAPDQLGLLATLEETLIVWQPGTQCALEIVIGGGLAEALETVPGAFEVAAPGSISLGDSLVVSWRPSDDADYYVVRATLESASRDQVELSATVQDTMVVFESSEITVSGCLVGWVAAVAGPFPATGTDGNVSGIAWGFFTIAYHDTMSLFEVTVENAAR